tara:strand:+ start:602 stop:991 length:390 start_codon:yes stop_codon:yes gene_type:complete
MIDTGKYEGHTQGPWKLERHESTFTISKPRQYGTDKFWKLASVVCNRPHTDPGFGSGQQDHRNALLIADAPDLLAEVKRLRGLLIQSYDELSLATRWVERYFESKGRSCADVAQAVENLEKFIEEGGEE